MTAFHTLIACLIASANATPLRGSSRLATFDDLTTNPLLPSLSPVGDYMGLNWGGFLVTSATQVIPPVQPASGKNVAAWGIENGPMNITSDSTTTCFTPKSVNFGCLANTAATAASVPQACTIAFTAYRDNIAVETINESFQPDNTLSSKMVKVQFPRSFSGLQRMEMAIVSSTVPELVSAVAMDSVSYITY